LPVYSRPRPLGTRTVDERIARLPAAAGRVFLSRDAQAVLAAVCAVDVSRLDLWHLERADARAERDDDVGAITRGRPPEVLDPVVGTRQFQNRDFHHSEMTETAK
jgi:hypothetical protein